MWPLARREHTVCGEFRVKSNKNCLLTVQRNFTKGGSLDTLLPVLPRDNMVTPNFCRFDMKCSHVYRLGTKNMNDSLVL